MADKLEKIGAELKRARVKRDEWNERVKILEEKYREEENTQICDITHAENLTPSQLAQLIRLMKTNVPSGDLMDVLKNKSEDGKSETEHAQPVETKHGEGEQYEG